MYWFLVCSSIFSVGKVNNTTTDITTHYFRAKLMRLFKVNVYKKCVSMADSLSMNIPFCLCFMLNSKSTRKPPPFVVQSGHYSFTAFMFLSSKSTFIIKSNLILIYACSNQPSSRLPYGVGRGEGAGDGAKVIINRDIGYSYSAVSKDIKGLGACWSENWYLF